MSTLLKTTKVADCAEHPADIKVTSWKEITCATCGEQTFGDTDPAIVCYYGEVGETESGSGSGSGGDDEGSDDDGGNGAVESPSPSAAGEGGVTIDVNGEPEEHGSSSNHKAGVFFLFSLCHLLVSVHSNLCRRGGAKMELLEVEYCICGWITVCCF